MAGANAWCVFPPNHWWICFRLADFPVTVSDACATGPLAWRFAGCRSSQPADGLGDGSTQDDCRVSPDGTQVCARVERQGGEPGGRTYAVELVALDGCGNASLAEVGTIHVPHDLSAAPGCMSGTGLEGRAARTLPF